MNPALGHETLSPANGQAVGLALSGGVDSLVAAHLLIKEGRHPIAVTMKLGPCHHDAMAAEMAARALSIPLSIHDLGEDFHRTVIAKFINVYAGGATPNPCVDCNREMKFGRLREKARAMGAGLFATGHYARIARDENNGRYLLKKAVDTAKDQSYVLYSLSQEQLAGVIFPLGNLYKNDVKNIATVQGFAQGSCPDSQDICFIPDGDYPAFIERHLGGSVPAGDFLDRAGNAIGRHRGLIRYTIGQRKGLGLSGAKPLYVVAKDAAANTVTLGGEEDLCSRSLEAVDCNWIAWAKPPPAIRAKARVRYGQQEQQATAYPLDGKRARVEFDEPQRGIAAGQAVVLYDGDIVIGGGTIA